MFQRFHMPYDVVIVAEKETLFLFFGVVNDCHASHKVNDLIVQIVEQIRSDFVSSVPVDPLQSQLTLWSCSIGHLFVRNLSELKLFA
jgi:hypothetical protein